MLCTGPSPRFPHPYRSPPGPLPQVYIDGDLRVPYHSMLRVNQVRPELQVVDPGDA
jgi:hypothetical protein